MERPRPKTRNRLGRGLVRSQFCLAVRSTVRHEEMSSGVEKQVAACPMRICIQSAAANGKAF